MQNFKRKKITYTKIYNRIVCKNPESIKQDRINYSNNFDYDNYNNYYYLDEFSCHVGDKKRKGYSQINKQIKIIQKHKKK